MKEKVLYIHGFGGSGNGTTAQTLKRLFSDKVVFDAITLSNDLDDVESNLKMINEYIEQHSPKVVMASSFGTFQLLNSHSVPYRVLINPVLRPADTLPEITSVTPSQSAMLKELAHIKMSKQDKLTTYCFFGEHDELVDFSADFRALLGADHCTVIKNGKHKFNETQLGVVVDFVCKLTGTEDF